MTNPDFIIRNTYGEIEVGDSIGTHVDHKNGPSSAYANGHSWQGEVIAVSRLESGKVDITIAVTTRSLCADDLVHGFGRGPNGTSRPVIHHIARDPGEYVHQRVRDARTGRRYWTGVDAGCRRVTEEIPF